MTILIVVVLGILALFFLLVAGAAAENSSDGCCTVATCFGLVSLIAFGCLCYCNGYRSGQIDAANGTQNFILVKDSNGESSWEWSSKENKNAK